MLHFAVYSQNYQITTGPGASRPDLIGLSANNEWFVFEAKGRSNGFDTEALTTAKDQAEQIISVDNVAPLCRIASQAFFSADGLRFRMDDPEHQESRPSRTLNITRDDFEHAYYAPIRDIISSRPARELVLGRRKVRGVRVEEADLSIALIEQGAPVNQAEAVPHSADAYFGRDGILVQLGSSWSQANMRLQPHLRANL